MNDVKLRVWPGVVAAALIIVGNIVGNLFLITLQDVAIGGVIASILGLLVGLIWWLFLSRAPWLERLFGLGALIAIWFALRLFLHESIINGAMGALPIFLGVPVLTAALAIAVVATRERSSGFRRMAMVGAMVLAAGMCTLVRTAGLRGAFFELHWRWTPTPEELLLARGTEEFASVLPATVTEATTKPTAPDVANVPPAPAAPAAPTPAKPAEWPGFRGSGRDSIVHNVRIETDWSKSPPMELWRRPIGPGWSSFAVDGDLIYTQEQRGEDELVASYQLSTGKPVWRHKDSARFWESNGGAGPRGTPSLLNGRVYAFGGTGLLNVLDAATGAVVWSRNVSKDAEVQVPQWGFSSSPLLINDMVVVAAEGKLAAYDRATGKPRWFGPQAGFGYSSPQLVSIEGIPQILLLSNGATSFAPADGAVLWRSEWEGGAIVQPAVTADGNILINAIGGAGGQGIKRLAISHQAGGWTVEERWTSSGLKPYFNDFVVHKGHAYGFDGSILSCIDLTDGTRKWKGGRYGGGQLLLLADQDVLLVLSDEGELALVNATPDGFKELSKFKAIEGKTWNHPVVVNDTVLVRNGEEMAAFKLKRAQ